MCEIPLSLPLKNFTMPFDAREQRDEFFINYEKRKFMRFFMKRIIFFFITEVTFDNA